MFLRPTLLGLLAASSLMAQVTLLPAASKPRPAHRSLPPRPPSTPVSGADLARLRPQLASLFQISEALVPVVLIPGSALLKPGAILTVEPGKPLPLDSGFGLYKATFEAGAQTGAVEPPTVHGESGASMHFWTAVPGKGSFLMTLRVHTNLTHINLVGEQVVGGIGTMGTEYQVPIVNGRAWVAYDYAGPGPGRLGLGVGFGPLANTQWCQVVACDFVRVK